MTGLRSNEDLVRLYRKTNEESYIRALIEENEPLLIGWASEYQIKGYDIEDLVQEGLMELMRIIPLYDEGKEIKFITFLKVCVRQRYNRLYATATRQRRGGSKADLLALDDTETLIQAVTVQDYTEIEVEAYLESLSPLYKGIAVQLTSGYTLSQIAEGLGISNATMSYHIKKIRAYTNDYFMI